MTHDPAIHPAAGRGSAVVPWSADPTRAPRADPDAVPEGFVVLADGDVRLHFLDWGGPAGGSGVLLLPGLLQPAWSWAPVARRLASRRRTNVTDLRGQGLSDAPQAGYDLDTLVGDAIAVAEGAGILAIGPITLAGHGFGAIVAAAAAAALGERCARLVLVDGGWERLETTTDVDVDEFLRGIDEPPEVLRSMEAYLADRRAFDAATWDADQERAARDSVVETAAGHVVPAVRPHVVEEIVRTMFEYEPGSVLAGVAAPVVALVALASGDVDMRLAELRRTAEMRVAAGLGPIQAASFPSAAHNLMRYRPDEVAAAILQPIG
jgi:pimeloyl-ACP methyl ester carboxylesterase